MKKSSVEIIKANFLKYIEKNINNYSSHPLFLETFKYNLVSNGKYIRPLLFLCLMEDEYEKYYDIALSIEMLHSYSLIHDDLPAMDNDTYRRGKLTTHKKYGEDVAILTGDGLLTHSFEKIINTQLDADLKLEIIQVFIKAAGINQGMINGQLLDIKNKGNIKEKELKQLHKQKTGEVLALPFEFYALIKQLNFQEFRELGLEIGLLYQIRDDYLDVYGSFNQEGKTLGKDKNLEKRTFANFYDKKKLEKLIQDKSKKIIIKMKELNINETVQDLIKNIFESSN